MEKLNLESGKALVLVAHPDDETIWMGGTILRHKNIDWTVLVLCRKSDTDRMPKFLKVCNFLNVKGFIFDAEDERKLNLKETINEFKKILRRELRGKKFDYVFFHGASGEYGHEKHKALHQVLKDMLESGELRVRKRFCFDYSLDKKNKFCVFSPRADLYNKLSVKEFKTKRDIVKKLYGFGKFSFENRSCSKIETFSELKK